MSNRNEYMKAYMAKRRADQPASKRGRMERGLRMIIVELGTPTGEKGKLLLSIATDALKSEEKS